MEKGLKEYFAKLSENFWQPGNNLNIKREMGYKQEHNVGDMSWFFKAIYSPKRLDTTELAFSVNFYNFYKQVIDDEPDLLNLLGLLPISYHRIILKEYSDPFDALSTIVFTIEKDLCKDELINYFKLNRN